MEGENEMMNGTQVDQKWGEINTGQFRVTGHALTRTRQIVLDNWVSASRDSVDGG
jgi:hypothetical protein